jgi:hypothetical protein
MISRPKYHWIAPLMAGFYALMASLICLLKKDHFLVPIYLGSALLLIIGWITSYTKLENGILIKRVFLFPACKLYIDQIQSVLPHRKNGKWGYGTVVIILGRSGQKMTLQPNHPKEFLAALREQAPQAAFQV